MPLRLGVICGEARGDQLNKQLFTELRPHVPPQPWAAAEGSRILIPACLLAFPLGGSAAPSPRRMLSAVYAPGADSLFRSEGAHCCAGFVPDPAGFDVQTFWVLLVALGLPSRPSRRVPVVLKHVHPFEPMVPPPHLVLTPPLLPFSGNRVWALGVPTAALHPGLCTELESVHAHAHTAKMCAHTQQTVHVHTHKRHT